MFNIAFNLVTLPFRDNGIFLQNMNDVIVFSTKGAVNSSRRRRLVGRSRLPISVHQKVFVYRTPFPTLQCFFCKPERLLCDSSARGRYIQFSMTDSERATTDPLTDQRKFHLHLRFRDNDVFLQAGTDVMMLYPQGGAVRRLL